MSITRGIILGILLSGTAVLGAADTIDDPKAAYELAEELRKTATGQADLRQALKIQQALLAQGSKRSQLRVAQLHFLLGEKEAAMRAYTAAAEGGSASARMSLAKYHANGGFGGASDPDKGLTLLKDMAQGPDPARAQMTLADLYADGVGGTPTEAFALYKTLADGGSPRALSKIGSAYLKGDVVAKDMAMAEEALSAAVEGGYDSALLNLSAAQIATGKGAAAAASLEKAVAMNLKSAGVKQALAHYNGDLGAASDKAMGQKQLIDLAEQGDTAAANIVLRNHERRSTRMAGVDLPVMIGALEDRMSRGDARATKVLARAYRNLRRYIPGASRKHAALVADHLDQLPEKDRYAEMVTAQYDLGNHGKSRRALTEQLSDVSGPAFVSAAMRMRGIERTSFVYLMQKELGALGAYRGSASGKLTQGTINSIFAFCKDAGIFDTCKHGPVTYESSLLISQAVAEQKQARLSESSKN